MKLNITKHFIFISEEARQASQWKILKLGLEIWPAG